MSLLNASSVTGQLISALILRCTPYLWRPGRGCAGEHVAHEPHAAVSACLSRHFNCYISSALIWAKREASAEPGTSKATSPSLTSCLSLWRSPGFGEPEKGIGEAVWIPGWNEFDGLIVAPSGHRHSSQRAGRAGSRNCGWGAAVAGKYSC